MQQLHDLVGQQRTIFLGHRLLEIFQGDARPHPILALDLGVDDPFEPHDLIVVKIVRVRIFLPLLEALLGLALLIRDAYSIQKAP